MLDNTIEKRGITGKAFQRNICKASSARVLNDSNNKQLSYTHSKKRGRIEKKVRHGEEEIDKLVCDLKCVDITLS